MIPTILPSLLLYLAVAFQDCAVHGAMPVARLAVKLEHIPIPVPPLKQHIAQSVDRLPLGPTPMRSRKAQLDIRHGGDSAGTRLKRLEQITAHDQTVPSSDEALLHEFANSLASLMTSHGGGGGEERRVAAKATMQSSLSKLLGPPETKTQTSATSSSQEPEWWKEHQAFKEKHPVPQTNDLDLLLRAERQHFENLIQAVSRDPARARARERMRAEDGGKFDEWIAAKRAEIAERREQERQAKRNAITL